MNPWDTSEEGSDARALATIAFCDELNRMSAEDRKKHTLPQPNEAAAKAASDKAKALFAKLGGFVVQGTANPEQVTEIPADLMFRVYEEGFPPGSPDRPWFADRDDIVTMVLPQPGEDPDLDPSDYYRCSYWPYFTGDSRSPIVRARTKERLATARREAAANRGT